MGPIRGTRELWGMGNPTGFILPNGFLVMSAIERSPKKRASKQPIVENRQKESRKKKKRKDKSEKEKKKKLREAQKDER